MFSVMKNSFSRRHKVMVRAKMGCSQELQHCREAHLGSHPIPAPISLSLPPYLFILGLFQKIIVASACVPWCVCVAPTVSCAAALLVSWGSGGVLARGMISLLSPNA